MTTKTAQEDSVDKVDAGKTDTDKTGVEKEAVDTEAVESDAVDSEAVETEPAADAGPARPPRRHGRLRSFLRVLRTLTVILALVAGAVAGGVYIARQRLEAKSFVELGKAVLAAEAVPVGATDASEVIDVLVDEKRHVAAGDELARVKSTAVNPIKPPETKSLRAPTAGTVVSVNVTPGAIAKPGEAVITMYDRAKLTFQVNVSVERLRKLKLGMAVSIAGPGLPRPIGATLDHVVPRFGVEALGATDRLPVVLVPRSEEMDTVATLVPGLQFTASVDIKTAGGTTPAINSAG